MDFSYDIADFINAYSCVLPGSSQKFTTKQYKVYFNHDLYVMTLDSFTAFIVTVTHTSYIRIHLPGFDTLAGWCSDLRAYECSKNNTLVGLLNSSHGFMCQGTRTTFTTSAYFSTIGGFFENQMASF